jgi:hypothetical protein
MLHLTLVDLGQLGLQGTGWASRLALWTDFSLSLRKSHNIVNLSSNVRPH